MGLHHCDVATRDPTSKLLNYLKGTCPKLGVTHNYKIWQIDVIIFILYVKLSEDSSWHDPSVLCIPNIQIECVSFLILFTNSSKHLAVGISGLMRIKDFGFNISEYEPYVYVRAIRNTIADSTMKYAQIDHLFKF